MSPITTTIYIYRNKKACIKNYLVIYTTLNILLFVSPAKTNFDIGFDALNLELNSLTLFLYLSRIHNSRQ